MATINGGKGREALYGSADNDFIYGNGGNDRIYGYSGNDYLRGGTGDDDIQGHEGDDQIFGDEGRDTLFGQQGNDHMEGGAGNDQLWGGTGEDTQRGGTGADTFNFGRSIDSTVRTTEQVQAVTLDSRDVAGIDTILDFSQAEGDRINISRIDALDQTKDGLNTNNPFTVVNTPSTAAGTAWVVYDPYQAGHATIYLNQDGGDAAEFQLEVYGSFTTLRWGLDIVI